MKSLQFKFPKYEKFKNIKKMTVVFIDNGYFMYKQFENAFAKKGHNVNIFKIKKGEKISTSYYRNFIDDLEVVKPDFIFTINFTGLDEDGKLLSMLSAIEIPIVCYLIDSPFYTLKKNIINIDYDILKLFVIDSSWIDVINTLFNNDKNKNGKIYHLPLAVNEEIIEYSNSNFSKQSTSKSLNVSSKIDSTLFYHGSTYLNILDKINIEEPYPTTIYSRNKETEENGILEELLFEKKDINSYFEEIRKELILQNKNTKNVKNIVNIFDEFENKNSIIFEFKDLEILLSLYYKLSLEVDLKIRTDFLNSLNNSFNESNLKLIVEGDVRWIDQLDLKIPITSDILSHEELLNLYYRSEFTLNISGPLNQTSFNQKILETFISNGFIITDYKKDYELILPKDYKYLDLNNKESIADVVGYYQKIESLKKEVSKYAKNQIMKHHRYRNRVEEIENIIMNGKW